jgi:hypothetical protein
MTCDEHTQAVAKMGGFTERQARFLVTVMLHAGVCVPRQYATFCGIVHGQKTRKFFAKLVRLGLASRSRLSPAPEGALSSHWPGRESSAPTVDTRPCHPASHGPRRDRDESRRGVAGDG